MTEQEYRERRLLPRLDCEFEVFLQTDSEQLPAYQRAEAETISLLGLGVVFEPGAVQLSTGNKFVISRGGRSRVRAVCRWVGRGRAGFEFFGSTRANAETWVGDILAGKGVLMRQALKAAKAISQGSLKP